MVAASASNFTGVPHVSAPPLTQKQLDAAMAHGPIIQIIGQQVINQALIIGGCGGGKYYRHDPKTAYGHWEELTSGQLLIKPPNIMWQATVLPESDAPRD